MLHRAISHARLMRESTDRVEAALDSSDAGEQLVARRVLENPAVWDLWEREHSNLMRRLADCGARAQLAELKHTNFRLLHGTALFEYLRGSALRGAQRQRLIAHFRPGRSYEAALISEHGAYLRKACSFLCTSHLGSDVVRDPVFLDPMQRYEELYAEYFEMYCATLIAPADEAESKGALLPLLKHQLHEYRLAILDPRTAQPFLKREADLRRAGGDTQRLKTLGPRPK
ncbi:MAG TPA: hypothetical protein VHY75_15525 [Steroidobacteraceae bacterium]|jgi:hypothetical protein|nr:hypothetical protein [Steroidobacteraceae bacterium]